MVKMSDRDQFEAWLMEMDASIGLFLESLPDSIRQRLDHSVESVDALEELILSRYSKSDGLLAPSEGKFLDGAARYVGEIARKQTASKWTVELSEPMSAFYKLPVLTGGKLAADLCPMALITASASRRTGHFLSSVLGNVGL